MIISAGPITTNSGFITLGGNINNKFLGSINEINSFEIVPKTTTIIPSTTTSAQTTQATTRAPTTQATTRAPTTQATNQAPTTQAPTTQAPTTQAPTIQAPTCDTKDTSKCIFKDYKRSGSSCVAPTNSQDSYGGLESYNNNEVVSWLNSLYNRNAGNDPNKNERSNVVDYVNRCKNQSGYSHLNNTIPAGGASVAVVSQNSDGCNYQFQACRCSNTGLNGACNYGPHKSGLYCRCD